MGPPIKFIPLSTQMRALNLILRVLVEDGGDDTIVPEETSGLSTEDYIYTPDSAEVFGLPITEDEALDVPRKSFLLPTPNAFDYMKTVDAGRQSIIVYLLSQERLTRLITQEWAQEGQGIEAMTLSLYLETITKALFGPGLDDIDGLDDDTEDPTLITTLFPKTLIKSKWSIQSFWVD